MPSPQEIEIQVLSIDEAPPTRDLVSATPSVVACRYGKSSVAYLAQ